MLKRQAIPDGWTAALIDPEHTIAGRSRAEAEFVGTQTTPSLMAEIGRSPERFFFSLNKEGARVYTAFSTSPETGWTAAIGAPAALVEAPLRRSQLALLVGGGAAAMLLALGLAWLLIRAILARQDAERRALRAESEREAERRLSDVAAHFPGVIYRRVMHADGRVSYPYVSDGVASLLGPGASEVFRSPTPIEEIARELLFPDDLERWRKAMTRSVAELAPYDMEGRIRRPDGTVRWVRSMASTRRGPGASVIWDGVILDIAPLKDAQEALREEARTLEAINRTIPEIAAELDVDRLVQTVTDAATRLSGAQFGAFFYNVTGEAGDKYMLYALSGAEREAFSRFPMPHKTAIFGPTFDGEAPVRLDDVTQDPRFGRGERYRGMPPGHLPVRSYLAVPVISRSGEVIGGLFFGHSEPGIFTERAEQIVVAIAAQAAVAMDNARLFRRAEEEIAQRKRAEADQALLLAELNHRVKNTLAVVLAIAQQTLRRSPSLEAFGPAFGGRLRALAHAHTLLTEGNWTTTPLRALVEQALTPHMDASLARATIGGPHVIVPPKPALAMSLILHELATNAAKYGALSLPSGTVAITWRATEAGDLLCLRWEERGGPPVTPPKERGFGSQLIEINVAHELGGTIEQDFAEAGYSCEICVPWDPKTGELAPGGAKAA